MRKLFLLFFLSIIFVGLCWIVLVPMWHFPDEQAHFGQVAFIAQKGRNPNRTENDLTEEIYVSEQLLGTARDKYGNNKFTFHPEYRIEYTDSIFGKYESSISALTKTSAKQNFIHVESARYPYLYYLPAVLLYKLFYFADIFVRVYVVRFWSLILFFGTAALSFLMGKLIFPKDNLSSITLAILVGFQPMMVFANVGVNSDALGNFLFTLFLYFSVKIIITGLKLKDFILILLFAGLSIYSKPQFIVTLPLLLLLSLWIDPKKSFRIKIFNIFTIIAISLIFYLVLYLLKNEPALSMSLFLRKLNIVSLLEYYWKYTIPHTISEVLPWYWGVYDWLGVTYSRVAHRIINRLIIIAGIGILVWIVKIVKNREWGKKEIQAILFLNIAAIFYFIAISFYDWFLWYTSKYPLGVQGRYFFPLISVHMLMLMIGFQQFFPQNGKLYRFVIKLLGLLMIILNFYAIYTIVKTYYDLLPVTTFITQVSQYKPWFFKGMFLVILLFGFFTTLLLFLIEFIRYPHERKN